MDYIKRLLIHLVFLAWLPSIALSRPLISYAALGDSYPTGNGAGFPENVGCGRFSGAYPAEVARQLVLAYSNLACAGSFISTVLHTQVPWIGDSDVVSVEVGGNEADFFALLNECVQQWRPISTCEREVVRAKNMIQSASFIDAYDNLISVTRARMKPEAILLVLGYARFFNENTDQCSGISFSRTDPNNHLTQERRRVFNEIVAMVNTVMKGAAEAHGASFVDVDTVFDGHRFCEEGTVEPALSKSWFFSGIDVPGQALSVQGISRTAFDGATGGFFELTRTFHPTIEGHRAIADEIVRVLRAR